MVLGRSGQRLKTVPKPLQQPLANLLKRQPTDAQVIQLALQVGFAVAPAVRLIEDDSRPAADRIAVIQAVGQTRAAGAVKPLLRLVGRGEPEKVQAAALAALAYFDDQRIAAQVRHVYPSLKPAAKSQAIDLLCGRPHGAMTLLAAIEKKEIRAEEVSLDLVARLLEHDDPRLVRLVTRTWGRVRQATPLQIQGRISAVSQLLHRGKGNPVPGRKLFDKVCANCHKLHSQGTVIGPDLTGAERKDMQKLIRNIVDPSSEIRPQYVSHIAVTKDGRVITGLLAESNAATITLLDAKNKRTVLRRDDIEELRESAVSLMPEKLLEPMTDQQIRDLLAYLQTDVPSQKK